MPYPVKHNKHKNGGPSMNGVGFGVAPLRDPEWDNEVWRETVRSVLITEQRAYLTNQLAIVAFAIATSFLPVSKPFILPLVMRFLAATGTHLSYRHLRSRLEAGHDLDPPLRLLALMLFFGGMSWGYLLLPLLADPHLHPLRLVLGGAVLVGVALVVTMTAPLRVQAVSFMCGFLVILVLALGLTPTGDFLPTLAGLATVLAAISLYAFASMRQHEASAEMLVENRRLSEDLAEALAQAEFLAKHDPLTGLFNRRALFETELARSSVNSGMHLLLIDLDNFKKLNDRFGHDAGDRALIALSDLLRQVMRDYGPGNHFAVRLGGEEFALYLDEPDEEKAAQFAEDLREAIGCMHECLGLEIGATSASIGLSHHAIADPVEEAIGRADKAMYDAKSQGRNRVRHNLRGDLV